VSEYTKGPWEAEEEIRRDGTVAIGAPSWGNFARVVVKMSSNSQSPGMSEEGLANKNLILAAPEMLTALKDARRMAIEFGAPQEYWTEEHKELLARIDAAIAKATPAPSSPAPVSPASPESNPPVAPPSEDRPV